MKVIKSITYQSDSRLQLTPEASHREEGRGQNDSCEMNRPTPEAPLKKEACRLDSFVDQIMG